MLRAAGAIPLAMRIRAGRWVYGIARYDGDELRYYRALRPRDAAEPRAAPQLAGRRQPPRAAR